MIPGIGFKGGILKAGKKLPAQYFIGTTGNYSVIVSNDYGTTFTSRYIPNVTVSACLSDNGLYQYVSGMYGQIWKSSNSGASFSEVGSGYGYVSEICCNSTGQYVLAVGGGMLRKSSNYGASFSSLGSSVSGACISADGVYQFYSTNVGKIYRSTNSGSTFSEVGTDSNYSLMTCSASGQYVYAGLDAPGYAAKSTDYGATWTSQGYTQGGFSDFRCSATGQYLGLSTTGSTKYRSTNKGAYWNAVTSLGFSSGNDNFFINSLGDKWVYAPSYSGGLKISSDYGVNFEILPGASGLTNSWGCIALNKNE